MDSAKLNDWMQVIGIFALVASLVFVGLQMKQSQEIAIAAQYHDRAALAVENFHAQLESGDLSVWGRRSGLELTSNFSAEDAGRAFLGVQAYLVMADNHLYQYESGFMEESSWQAQRALLKSALNSGQPLGARNILLRTAGIRRESFLKLCEQLIEEGKTEAGKQ